MGLWATGGWFCQNRVPKFGIQEVQPTGEKAGSVQQAAPRARHLDCGKNAAKRLELGAVCRDLTRGSVHAPWCPLSPIYALGFSELKEEEFLGEF